MFSYGSSKKLIRASLVIILLKTSSISASTSCSDSFEYRNACLEAATDEQNFQTFKQNPSYTSILEHVSQSYGQEIFKLITQEYPHLIKRFEKFKKNDIVGMPCTYEYPSIGQASPTTLRYVKVLGDLESIFGCLKEKKIIEIGVGYGGQCLIISREFDFKEYRLVDLAEPLALTEKYLNFHNVKNFKCSTAYSLVPEESYDLVISNYAFSECMRPVQEFYLKTILKNAKHGYLTLNNQANAIKGGFFTLEELIEALTSYGFNPRMRIDRPQYNCFDSLILSW